MAETAKQEPVITMWSKEFTYDRWMKTKFYPYGLLHRDLRLSWGGGEERQCKAAFIQLLGQEESARPGCLKSSPAKPFRP